MAEQTNKAWYKDIYRISFCKTVSIILVLLLCFSLIAGCTSNTYDQESDTQETIEDFNATEFVNNEYFGKTESEIIEIGFSQIENTYLKIDKTLFSDQTYISCILGDSGTVTGLGYLWKNASLNDAVDQSVAIKKILDAQAKEIISVTQDDEEINFNKDSIMQAIQNSDSRVICMWTIDNYADLAYSIEKTEEGATCILITHDKRESSSNEPSTIVYDAELGSGNYTSGVDFPAGIYNFTAIKGGGNVSSDNLYEGGINAIMGVKDDDFYQKEYANIYLPYGTKLSISGVTIQIHSDSASGMPLTQREQQLTEEISLGNGNFVAGTDFPAGVYDIVAVSGGGNVSSDNLLDGGINAILGVKDDDFYIKEYKNIELPSGTTLKVDRVKIKLIPSK